MSEAPHTIVVTEPPQTEVTVLELGRLVVRGGGRTLHREMRWRARRPLAVDYRDFANTLLAAAVEPHVSLTIVDRLPEPARRKLMLAVVRLRGGEAEWRALYGSSLSFDERFFAVLLWSWTDERARVLRRVRELARRPPVATSVDGLGVERFERRMARIGG